MAGSVQYNFRDASVLIVGASSGIGLATALAFAGAGARIAVCDLTATQGDLQGRLKAAGAAEVLAFDVDVRQEDQLRDAIATAARQFGRFDVAINNAGIEGPFGSLHELAAEDFDRIIAINLRGVFLGMKYQIPHMAEPGGVIINTTSTAGVQSIPGVGGYSASKHGIVGLTRAAALELAPKGIRVNAVAPGPVDTGLLDRMVAGHIPVDAIATQVPLQRISRPEEIANLYLWLASDAASFVTGEVAMIDGGLTIA